MKTLPLEWRWAEKGFWEAHGVERTYLLIAPDEDLEVWGLDYGDLDLGTFDTREEAEAEANAHNQRRVAKAMARR